MSLTSDEIREESNDDSSPAVADMDDEDEEDYTLEELIDQLGNTSCDHVGPYEKDGDNEENIKDLFAYYGYKINFEGIPVPMDWTPEDQE